MAQIRDREHLLLRGVADIIDSYRTSTRRERLFDDLSDQLRENWSKYRQPRRSPSLKNWAFRVAPNCSPHPTKYLEKQLQKAIATCMRKKGWGNDMPTASGLVDSRARQMNIDLAHELPEGFELFELKVASDTPFYAATQILRYAAIYRLYREQAELIDLFPENRVLAAKKIAWKVLAPRAYYNGSEVDLPTLETQIDQQVRQWGEHASCPVEMSFEFLSFPVDFAYQPGMGCAALRCAVLKRCSPFKPNRHSSAGGSARERRNP